MAFENRHIFNGKINNQSVNDFNVDYTKDSVEDRLTIVEEQLNMVKDKFKRNFFEIYFDDFYLCHVKTTDALAEKINICKKLELMADYILRSIEVRQERKDKEYKYYFYVNRDEFIKRTANEGAILGLTDRDEELVMHFLSTAQKRNPKKEKKQKIERKDIMRNDELGKILSEYQLFIEKLTEDINNGHMRKRKADKMKGAVVGDMIQTKDSLLGVWGYNMKNLIKDSTVPSWDMFDYTNENHIKYAIAMHRDEIDPSDDLSHIILDMELITKKLHKEKTITDRQYEILTYLKQGYSYQDIGDELGITRMAIYNSVKAISKNIAKHYQKLENK